MSEQDDPREPGASENGVRDAVKDEVDDARREIFSAYVRARELGVLLSREEAAADDGDDAPPQRP